MSIGIDIKKEWLKELEEELEKKQTITKDLKLEQQKLIIKKDTIIAVGSEMTEQKEDYQKFFELEELEKEIEILQGKVNDQDYKNHIKYLQSTIQYLKITI